MFSSKSFSPASFSAMAWLLDQIIKQATPIEDGFNPTISSDGYRHTPLKRRQLRRRRQQDILFL